MSQPVIGLTLDYETGCLPEALWNNWFTDPI